MLGITLTQYSGAILGPISKLLGLILNYLYIFLDTVFNVQNIGLCIILFTIIIYMCMLPLTIKQQKFSKLSQKMQPEIQAVQKKYKGKKDQASMQAMQEETQIVYEKYGVSPTGSCVQLLIQMPIFLALYRVINNIPAYVSSVKDEFMPVVNGIMELPDYQDKFTKFVENIDLKGVALNFEGTTLEASNSIIDVIYKIPHTAWDTLKSTFSTLDAPINALEVTLGHFNNFFGINIANSPSSLIRSGWESGKMLIVIVAILVPVLSALTQLINIKLMPQAASSGNNENDAMASSMKTMNYMMPLMSFVMVFSVPVGMGMYWIAGAVIRSIQQLVINRYMENIDLDDIIKKNQEKAKKKREKKGIPENRISSAAKLNTKNIGESKQTMSNSEKEKIIKNRTEYSKDANPNSLTAKANMVKEFNEKNSK